jgi:aminopeptidase YwaD
MKLIRLILSILLFSLPLQGQSEYATYAKKMLDTLSSGFLYGRGHVEQGEKKASYMVATEFFKMKLQKFSPAPSYYQNFTLSANIFPEVPLLAIDNNWLVCGTEFLPHPASGPLRGAFPVVFVDSTVFKKPSIFKKLGRTGLKNRVLVLDDRGLTPESKRIMQNLASHNPWGAIAVIELVDRLIFGISDKPKSFAHLHVKRDMFPTSIREVRINIQTSFIPEIMSQNVTGYILGKEIKDTMIVFTAHYDHLGQIGRHIIFPGANDNASGVAMMLALAQYFNKPENQPRYSIAFIGFGGEELGLLGSLHYVRNPIIPPGRIKLLVNLDMMGNGQDGITVVNAEASKRKFGILEKINRERNYVSVIKARENTANSDHYPFSRIGVPAFFLYTMGGSKAYHDIFDQRDSIPWPTFDPIFNLITDFTKAIQE